jgi:hypothetical protein
VSKSPEARAARSARIQAKLWRDKTAALILAATWNNEEPDNRLIDYAIRLTDALRKKLDRTYAPPSNTP